MSVRREKKMNKTVKFLMTAVLAASMIFSRCNKNSQDNKEEFDLSKKNEFVRTEYSAKTVEDGIYNNFQIGGYYDPTRRYSRGFRNGLRVNHFRSGSFD